MSAPATNPASSKMPLALGVIALLVALATLGLVVTKPSSQVARTPATQEFTLIMGEGEVLTGINETSGYLVPIDDPMADGEGSTGEYHRWEPGVLVVFVGDTIKLTVRNPRSNDHSFKVEAQPGDFSGTTQTGDIQGKKNSATTTGTSQVIEFTALKPGVYRWICNTPLDSANNKCDDDHPRMTGYLVVLA